MKVTYKHILITVFSGLLLLAAPQLLAQHDGHGHDHHDHHGHDHHDHGHDHHDHNHGTHKEDHKGHAHATHDDHHGHGGDHGHGCGHEEDGEYNPGETILNHISDANEFHVWKGVHIPLPCILYAPKQGWSTFLSSKFNHGHTAVDGYVMNHGRVNHIDDSYFDGKEVPVCITEKDGKAYAIHNDKSYLLDKPSTLDGGLLGGGITSFYDFSITKNVFTMMLAALLLFLVFSAVSRRYKKNDGKAPSGIQSLVEPIFTFIREEVTIPMIGEKHYERFQPFIMSLFFFILFCNLLGLIPFFPGSGNVTGNIGVTLVLAAFTFLVTNINGNGHYWQHIFWMPGVPIWVKPVLAVVEILGLIIKPFSLMIRLFANITAGHIIILSLIGLVFIFGKNGASIGGSTAGAIVGGAFSAFINLIEVLVAFIQAFVFAMLASSYIGAAVEDHHHDEHEHAHH